MTFFRSIGMAFSMFSSIPMPNLNWTASNMRYAMCAFPLVGVVIGGILYLWSLICPLLGFGNIVTAAGLTLIPVAVTGGIHMDGFCDTSDAVASHAEPERKREILKDSHAGVFAIISLCVYFLLYFAVSAEVSISGGMIFLIGVMHVISRSLSGLAVVLFAASGHKGLARSFQEAADKKLSAAILVLILIACAAALYLLGGAYALILLAVGLCCFLYLHRFEKKQFGGMSGDLAGWFLQVCELCMLVCLFILQKVVLL